MPVKKKLLLREEYIKLRDGLDNKTRIKKSASIFERLRRNKIYRSSNNIGFYCSFGSEVDTSLMIKKAIEDGKSIYLPVIDPADKEMCFCRFDGDVCGLICNSFGVPEPKIMLPLADKTLDLIVVPGLVFTKDGWRIGHGAGYYDRYLKKDDAPTCGVAFSIQITGSFPVDDFDVPLDYVLTEKDLFIRNKPKPVFLLA